LRLAPSCLFLSLAPGWAREQGREGDRLQAEEEE
jgi:hypothetical protein